MRCPHCQRFLNRNDFIHRADNPALAGGWGIPERKRPHMGSDNPDDLRRLLQKLAGILARHLWVRVAVKHALMLGNMPIIQIKIVQKCSNNQRPHVDAQMHSVANPQRHPRNLHTVIKRADAAVLKIIFHFQYPRIGEKRPKLSLHLRLFGSLPFRPTHCNFTSAKATVTCTAPLRKPSQLPGRERVYFSKKPCSAKGLP